MIKYCEYCGDNKAKKLIRLKNAEIFICDVCDNSVSIEEIKKFVKNGQ